MTETYAHGSVLFLSRPRSDGWPHHGRTFSIYLYPLSFWLTLPQRVLSTVRVVILPYAYQSNNGYASGLRWELVPQTHWSPSVDPLVKRPTRLDAMTDDVMGRWRWRNSTWRLHASASSSSDVMRRLSRQRQRQQI